MVGIVVQWQPRPIVTIYKQDTWADVSWPGGVSMIFEMGNIVEIQVEFTYYHAYGNQCRLRVYVEKQVRDSSGNPTWAPLTGYNPLEKSYESSTTEVRVDDINIQIPMDSPFLRFRVKVSTLIGGALPHNGGGSAPYFSNPDDPGNCREFLAYVDYLGDFSLEYLPMTILYCPPDQDMYNALTQSGDYGTITSMGFSEEVGTKSATSATVRGGVEIQFGKYGSASESISGGGGVEDSDIVEDAMKNKLALTYTWNTTLVADNQRIIGRRYWGPLGDLFLLLKNPWFSLIGTDQGEVLLTGNDKTQERTEILVVPGHALLRPDGDPVASRIPYYTRKRILELDPFYVNLDCFFPPLFMDEGIACYVWEKKAPSECIPVYRAYWTEKRIYVYTNSKSIYEDVWPNCPFLRIEGIAFHVLDPDKPRPLEPYTFVPLYYVQKTGKTFRDNDVVLTTSVEERDYCFSVGFQRPGILLGHVLAPDQGGDIPSGCAPLYRAYSEPMNHHMFTVSLEEFNALVKNRPPEDLSLAVNPYRDPSSGNRGALIARYGISGGVELDLSQVKGITVEDSHTTATESYWEVTESFGISNFFCVFGLSETQESSGYTGEFVRTRYQSSIENVVGKVKTALCKLVRNQNQTDLDDIEIYWDKQFSTFMFRKIGTGTGWLGGTVTQKIPGTMMNVWQVRNIELNLFNMSTILQQHPKPFASVFDSLGLSPVDPIPDVGVFVDKIIEMGFDIEEVVDSIPSNLIERTSTDHLGQYSFKNLRAGVYLLRAGDTLTRIDIADGDIKSGGCKSVDLQNVKRIFDPRESALWELKEILGIDTPTARRIQLALQNKRNLNEAAFGEILKSEKLSLSDFKRKAVLNLELGKVRPGEVLVEGWIVDPTGDGIRHLDVFLIGTDILKRDHSSFFDNWPDVDLEELLERLPPESYHRTKTDYLGKYVTRNLNAGSYQLVAGDRKMEMKVTEKESQSGAYKRLDLEGVKRRIDFSRTSFWEIRNTLNIPYYKAKRIGSALKDAEKLDQAMIESILTKEQVDLRMLKKRAIIRISGIKKKWISKEKS